MCGGLTGKLFCHEHKHWACPEKSKKKEVHCSTCYHTSSLGIGSRILAEQERDNDWFKLLDPQRIFPK